MKAIYSITNKINGHKYVGSARNFKQRKSLHVSQLNLKKHHSVYLQRAWEKHGSDNFIFSIVEEVNDLAMLIPREQYWIDEIQPVYNICKKAGSSLGIKRRPETVQKIRAAVLGVKHPQWRNDLKSESQGGENHWQYGKKMPDDVKIKKSESMKTYFLNNKSHLSKVVLKFSLDGIFIAEYESLMAAGNGIKSAADAISNCLRGLTKTSQQHIWKYKTA